MHDVDSDHEEEQDDHGQRHDLEEHEDEYLSAEHDNNEKYAYKNSHVKVLNNSHKGNEHEPKENGSLHHSFKHYDHAGSKNGVRIQEQPELRRHEQDQEIQNGRRSLTEKSLHVKEHNRAVHVKDPKLQHGYTDVEHVEMLEDANPPGQSLQLQDLETQQNVHSIKFHDNYEKDQQNNPEKDRHVNHRYLVDNFRLVQPLNGRLVLDVDTSVRYFKSFDKNVPHFQMGDNSEEIGNLKKRMRDLRTGFKLVRVRSGSARLYVTSLNILCALLLMTVTHGHLL